MPAEQLGHQDAFLQPRPNDRYRLSQGTLAGTRGNGENAPIADRGGLKRGRQQSTHSGRSLPSTAMPAHAPFRTFGPAYEIELLQRRTFRNRVLCGTADCANKIEMSPTLPFTNVTGVGPWGGPGALRRVAPTGKR